MGKGIPSPEEAGDPWDILVIGGHVLPGVWTVEGGVGRDLDAKTRKGDYGQRIRDKGYQNGDLTLVGVLAPEDEWEEFQGAPMKEIHPRRKGSAASVLGVHHPALAALGITEVIVERVHVPRPTRDGIEQRIDVREWIDQPKAVPKKKPVAKGPSAAQRVANQSVTVGRTLTHPVSGQEFVDTGIRMPSLDVTSALESNNTSALSQLVGN